MSLKMKDLIALFKKPGATSVELGVALNDARDELSHAEGELRRIGQVYSAALLEQDDIQVKSLMAQRENAAIARDRAGALVISLEARLSETQSAERKAAFEAKYAAVDARAEQVAQQVRKLYPKLARELVGLLKEVGNADLEVAALNQELRAWGATVPLKDVQMRGLPSAGPNALPHSIWGNTHLAPIEGFAPGWTLNDARSGVL